MPRGFKRSAGRKEPTAFTIKLISEPVPKDLSTSINSSRLAERMSLLRAHDAGTLDGLDCPTCYKQTVSVWFTHPAHNIYRIWFVCNECSFQMRAQSNGRPKEFSRDRVHPTLQAY